MFASSFDSDRFADVAAVDDGLLEDRALLDDDIVVADVVAAAGVVAVADVAAVVVDVTAALDDEVTDALPAAAEPDGTGVVAADPDTGVLPVGVDATIAAASFNSLEGVEARESTSLPLELVLSFFLGLAVAASEINSTIFS